MTENVLFISINPNQLVGVWIESTSCSAQKECPSYTFLTVSFFLLALFPLLVASGYMKCSVLCHIYSPKETRHQAN